VLDQVAAEWQQLELLGIYVWDALRLALGRLLDVTDAERDELLRIVIENEGVS
jgi:hypothetical protein